MKRPATGLSHPNIATIYDVLDGTEGPTLVMEYVPGESLAQHITRGAVPLGQTLGIVAQIVAGLSAAHAHGIIHRDLKPANIQITPDGTAKILDFGIAQVNLADPAQAEAPTRTAITEPARLAGTLGYMAPQAARGRTRGRADRHLRARRTHVRNADRAPAAITLAAEGDNCTLGKETTVKAKAGRNLTWKIENYCLARVTVSVGVFRNEEATNVENCDAEGSPYPFEPGARTATVEAGEPRSNGSIKPGKKDLKLKVKGRTDEGDEMISYYFNVCLNNNSTDPRLLVER